MSIAEARSEVSTETDLQAVYRLRNRLNIAMRGKADVVEMVLVCLLANGHLLLEDKPGLGKTTLAKALAAAIGGRFARCQCTPDLLPSDITGFNIFNQAPTRLSFVKGRSLQTSCWPMRSIEPLHAVKAHYWKRWPNVR